MSVDLTVLANYVDADVNYETTPADYIALDLTNDYLIWTEGDAIVKDLMTHEPTPAELNAAATKIDPDNPKTVAKCLLMDYSHDVGGSYYTHLVKGMSENKRYVYGFSFNGATASEPQLEAWDDSDHDSTDKHVLGNGTPANSFVKAVCTTASLPGVDWAGTAIAGANVLQLNNGNGALAALGSGETSQELYANIKIVIPQAYATPAVENFNLTIRYTWS
jgi:hypothetical protein